LQCVTVVVRRPFSIVYTVSPKKNVTPCDIFCQILSDFAIFWQKHTQEIWNQHTARANSYLVLYVRTVPCKNYRLVKSFVGGSDSCVSVCVRCPVSDLPVCLLATRRGTQWVNAWLQYTLRRPQNNAPPPPQQQQQQQSRHRPAQRYTGSVMDNSLQLALISTIV